MLVWEKFYRLQVTVYCRWPQTSVGLRAGSFKLLQSLRESVKSCSGSGWRCLQHDPMRHAAVWRHCGAHCYSKSSKQSQEDCFKDPTTQQSSTTTEKNHCDRGLEEIPKAVNLLPQSPSLWEKTQKMLHCLISHRSATGNRKCIMQKI